MAAAFASGWDPSSATDRHGSGAAHWAAGGGHVDALAWLVDVAGVDPSATLRKDRRRPIHWAARNGLEDMCWSVLARPDFVHLSSADVYGHAGLRCARGEDNLVASAWRSRSWEEKIQCICHGRSPQLGGCPLCCNEPGIG